MSNDLNLRERPDRIGRRDYFRQGTPIERWKTRLTLLALVITAGWLAAGVLLPNYGVQRYTHGTLASVHSTWDNQCEACHEPFQPINDNTWLHRWFSPPNTDIHWRNARCEGCHIGPAHHESIRPDAMGTCGSCHRDHQGRNHSLVNLPDSDCTNCHANLAPTLREGSKSEYANRITGFADAKQGHPDFKILQTFQPDQRGLKFSHALHMAPGIEYTAGSNRPVTYDRLIADAGVEVAMRYFRLEQQALTGEIWGDERIRSTLDQPDIRARKVQLDCAACHQLDTTDFRVSDAELFGLPKESLRQPRQSGWNFQPIAFEKHCAACHPLTFSDESAKERRVPHRLQPGQVNDFLTKLYSDDFLSKSPLALERGGPPSERLDARADENAVRNARAEIQRRVGLASQQILEKRMCLECHDTQRASPESAELVIRPTRIPTLYMTAAKFNHSAHRANDCQMCHDGTRGPITSPLVEREPLHLPGIDNCRSCHAPATGHGESVRGGAGHNCTECHRYHDGDHALAGPGTVRRDPMSKYPDPLRFRLGQMP